MIRLQLIEIDATGDAFTDSVSAVPIRRTTPTRVVAFTLMSEIQMPDDGAARVIDGNPNITGVR